MPRSKATNTPDSARPRYRFIGGKGGVGKTTCAAALAVISARRGQSTLVISTDPAPSLGDALGQRLGPKPRPVRGVRGLHAVEVDAAATLTKWLKPRRGVLADIALRGTWLDRDDVSRLLGLSLPGIDEIAGLLEIVELGANTKYDHVIVDTAPTGHLLRMLSMPAVFEGVARVFEHMQAQHRIMVEALRGRYVEDAADALIGEIDDRATAMRELVRDPIRAGVFWVTLPEKMAIEETVDAITWLQSEAIVVDGIIVNRLKPPPPDRCRWCDAIRRVEAQAMQSLFTDRIVRGRSVWSIDAVDREPRGIASLAQLGAMLTKRTERSSSSQRRAAASRVVATLGPLLSEKPSRSSAVIDLIGPPSTRLVMFGGKGGVGKTTCAAAAALHAAIEGPRRRVLLLSTDPAHSLSDVLGSKFSDEQQRIPLGPRNLWVRELNASLAFEALRDRVADGIEQLFQRVVEGGLGNRIVSHDQRVMRDLIDLAPPGIDELVATVQIVDTIDVHLETPRFDLVVMDTAPTGHALRLIETPSLVHDWVKALMGILLKYQPVVGVGALGGVLLRLSQGLGRLRDLMSDPSRARFVAVTRPASLPRLETARLLEHLNAARVSVPAVVVNAIGAGTCRRCVTQEEREVKEIARLRQDLATVGQHLLVVTPAEAPPPHGPDALEAWAEKWREMPGGAVARRSAKSGK